MKLNLVNIPKEGLIIDEEVKVPEEYFKNGGIKRLIKPWVKGKISINSAEEVIFTGQVQGKMVLLDAVDGEEIEYPFDITINENLTNYDEYNLENNENTLDIIDILWQNIVLEVPIRVTKHKDEEISLHGDGWEFVSNETKKVDSRMEALLDLLKEGKE